MGDGSNPTAPTGSWFKRGYDIPPEAKFSDDGGMKFIRFFLKRGTSGFVTLLDDEPFCLFEHSPTINGEFHHHATCLRGIPGRERCPSCDKKVKRAWIGALSLLDHRGYKKKDGTEIKYQKRLLVMKGRNIEIMQKHKARRGGLVHAKFEVSRTEGKQSAAIGDLWQYEGVVDLREEFPGIKDEDMKPFDYEKMFAPMTVADMEAWLKGASDQESVSYDGDEAGDAAPGQDDDIPF